MLPSLVKLSNYVHGACKCSYPVYDLILFCNAVENLGNTWSLFFSSLFLQNWVVVGDGSPGTMVKVACEPPDGYWKLNLGPPEEEPVLLAPEPSLQYLNSIFILNNIVYCYSETQLYFLELVWCFQVLKYVLIGGRDALWLSLNVSCCWAMYDPAIHHLWVISQEFAVWSVLGCVPAMQQFLTFPVSLLVGIYQLILDWLLGLPSEGLSY